MTGFPEGRLAGQEERGRRKGRCFIKKGKEKDGNFGDAEQKGRKVQFPSPKRKGGADTKKGKLNLVQLTEERFQNIWGKEGQRTTNLFAGGSVHRKGAKTSAMVTARACGRPEGRKRFRNHHHPGEGEKERRKKKKLGRAQRREEER